MDPTERVCVERLYHSSLRVLISVILACPPESPYHLEPWVFRGGSSDHQGII